MLFPSMVRVACVLAVVAAMAGTPSAQVAPRGNSGNSFLILHDWFGDSPCPTPTFLRQNKSFVDALPFDGIAVYLRSPDGADNPTMELMVNKPIGYAAIAKVLTPLKGLQFTNVTQNFAAIFSGRPPDFFSDWSTIIQNFSDLSKAIREVGLKGVYFDNENYFSKWSNYPIGVDHPAMSLKAYQDQARLRGRQVMEAMVANFPDIVVISLHGPYISEPKAPAPLFPPRWSGNQLMGPFFSGFMEGAGKKATCVDGGKLFHLRTAQEFQDSYLWRKAGIVQDKVDSEYIPAQLRLAWASRINIAFGVYDQPFGKADMHPEILKPTITLAMRQSDRYTWFCAERYSYLKPAKNGGAGDNWVAAVRQGRADAAQKQVRGGDNSKNQVRR